MVYMVSSVPTPAREYSRAWPQGLPSAPLSVKFISVYAKVAGLPGQLSPGRFCAYRLHSILEIAAAFYPKIALIL